MSKIIDVLDTSIKLAKVFNAAAPGVASVIAIIRSTDGKVHVMPLLDSAAEKFDDTVAEARRWLEDHPKK